MNSASNFQFLAAEFKPLHAHAIAAEALVHSDARACCMRIRHALEQAVHWLYEHDRDLRMPYDNQLNALLTHQQFERLVPDRIHQKMRLIQKFGNQAVHSNRFVHPGDALKLVRELFHVMFWLARTYTRASDPKAIDARFDDSRVPKLVSADEAAEQARALSKAELQAAEERFQAQIREQHEAIEQREAAIAESAATLEEREAQLAELNAELAAARAALAEAKAANIAVPDEHDYNEADTRRLLIDVLLREAGWVVGQTAGEEVPLEGMPNSQGEGFADYVLWGTDGKPLAVVEAKRTMKDPEVGQQQAKLYADCLQAMKGQRPLIFYTNGHQTWLWDDRRAPPRQVQGFYTRDELALAITRRDIVQPLRSLAINSDIVERPYQHRAIRSMSESFDSGKRAGLLTMATGTGKTRTAIALVDVLMRANLAKRVLFLADRVALVKQATNAFKTHLPDSSPVNLVTDKAGQGRVYLSTYPTMMGLIDQLDGERRAYGVGHFDVIIIDEAHRSVYQKYGAIFRYFDSLLVGLTATPRDEVDFDTYRLFGLETGVPTDAYSLDEAVDDGYLVPPRAQSVPIKFVREGIRYDELSDQEKEHWESLDWGDRDDDDVPDAVHAADINKKLYNEHTVDLMLQHLMEHGLRVDGGDTIGKTIIFAVNQRHANFIAERFDRNYPQYNGAFARVITHSVSYAQSLIDDFSDAAKLPQIAISVDMLDTGIDVPEVVNLVFFKAVRSKVKFLQMIGRGTRLCSDLFGPGQDKEAFLIFDFCGNFEYFNEHPEGAAASAAEPLGKRLFKRRLELLTALPARASDDAVVVRDEPGDYGGLRTLRAQLADDLQREVAAMNLQNFIVRPAGEFVLRYRERSAWEHIGDENFVDLRDHVAGLPSELPPDDMTAKLFDLTCLHLQLALVNETSEYPQYRDRIIGFAEALETKDTIPAVNAELSLIQDVQTDAFWKDVSLPMIETVRRKLRGLIQFIDRQAIHPVYTALQDEIGEATEVELLDATTGINLARYRRKVEAFIRDHEQHIAIERLKRNIALTPQDLNELERFVYESDVVGGRDQFVEAFGEDRSLAALIRSMVGLDRSAAMQAFSEYLDESRYSSTQIRFVQMIIEHLTRNGLMDPGQLYEPPFSGLHHDGVEGVFADAEVDALISCLQAVNQVAA
ncbi:DEAD/DEAH box helicase family protein [Abyssibacter profundi]|uniref:Restriction endonuclease subunit R n=1 Tax=Abyssibacter profundi TaxID=2182787 RepID=A0A363UQI2_9GAMM|nr:DEAD/DEAH box helicase family protein [Abyssibacter profundi]PWN57759.1 restriction endonuclease subunit R [Abyssibacter profundi]